MPAPSSFRGRRPRGASSEDWGPRSTPDGRAGSVRDGEKTPAASSSRERLGEPADEPRRAAAVLYPRSAASAADL